MKIVGLTGGIGSGKSIVAGYLTGYTIARALSPGMNITFARAGYRFGGLLWNNTQICGRLEPMNIWYKSLRPGDGAKRGEHSA